MRHEERAVYNRRPIVVTMGWDVPLQGYFMIIEPVEGDNPDADEDSGMIYSNLDDTSLPSGFSETIDHFKDRLKEMGITMSPEFFQTVLAVCD